MDPELLLNSLGFGGGAGFDDSLARVPDRFVQNHLKKQNAELQEFLLTHPEYAQLVPGMAGSMPLKGTSGYMQRTSPDMEEPAYSDLPDGAENQQSIGKGQCFDKVSSNLDISSQNSDAQSDLCITRDIQEDNQEDSGSGVTTDVKNKSKLLELCGIVPERYLIKSAKTTESSDSTAVIFPSEECANENQYSADVNTDREEKTDILKSVEQHRGGNIVVEAEVHAEIQSREITP